LTSDGDPPLQLEARFLSFQERIVFGFHGGVVLPFRGGKGACFSRKKPPFPPNPTAFLMVTYGSFFFPAGSLSPTGRSLFFFGASGTRALAGDCTSSPPFLHACSFILSGPQGHGAFPPPVSSPPPVTAVFPEDGVAAPISSASPFLFSSPEQACAVSLFLVAIPFRGGDFFVRVCF